MEPIIQNRLHIVPVSEDSTFDGVFQVQNSPLLLSFVTDINNLRFLRSRDRLVNQIKLNYSSQMKSKVLRSDCFYRKATTSDNRWKSDPRFFISSKTKFAYTWSNIQYKGVDVVAHFSTQISRSTWNAMKVNSEGSTGFQLACVPGAMKLLKSENLQPTLYSHAEHW